MTAPAPTELLPPDIIDAELRVRAFTFDGVDGNRARRALEKIMAFARQAASVERAEVAGEADIRKLVASCEGEQHKFNEWAASKGYSMEEHPLHYLFLEPQTYAARQGWKAALHYVEAALASPPRSEGVRASEVQSAIEQATNFDAQNLEYARDLLADLDDDYPDNETIVAQWFRKVRTETILAAGSAPPAQAIAKPPYPTDPADKKLAADWYTWGFQAGLEAERRGAVRDASPMPSADLGSGK